LYPDRSIQHIGIEFEDAHPVHSFRGCPLSQATEAGRDAARDVMSVTGACLLARRRDMLAVGGMALEFPVSYGDVDMCLRLKWSGWRVIVEPSAILIHHESASRPPVIEPWEWERFIARWGGAAHSMRPPVKSETDRNYDSPMTADLADGDDIEQLRHEILNLRERALGAEARSQFLADQTSNQADQIAELKDQVAERDNRLEEWKDRVAERDARIGERDTRLAERDLRIAEKDARLAQQLAEIADKDSRVAELEAEALRMQEDLGRPAIIRLARRLAPRSRKHERD
jgi:uncharacterized coiled-coil protein SlyX